MKFIYPVFTFICSLFATHLVNAQTHNFTASHTLAFTENKGQVRDQYGNTRYDIHYALKASSGLSIFLGNDGLHYQFYKNNTTSPLPPSKVESSHLGRGRFSNSPFEGGAGLPAGDVQMSRLDVTLLNANPNAEVIAGDMQPYYENYYTPGVCMDDAKAYTYSKITYKNIYPNIDWVLYIKDNKLEYDFMIHPGGKPEDIKIQYQGADSLVQHEDNRITAYTPYGTITEGRINAYLQEDHSMVQAQYQLKDNTLSCITSAYAGTLVLDPQLAWGTYFGGVQGAGAEGIAIDNTGNEYICGSTNSTAYIATAGAYQTDIGGQTDAFLAKFNSNGALLWATYYGGELADHANAVACDLAGNVYISGDTYSLNNIATPGSFQDSFIGYQDGFLAKFSSTGSIQWATYYGDSNAEVDGVACDMLGNVYMTGITKSFIGIATPGAFQDTVSGYGGAFVTKFSATGIRLWGTYFGNGTFGNGCTCDRNNNVYITGEVFGDSIYVTPGCYQDTCGGGYDAYIAKFDTMGNILWSTYYGGSNTDGAYGIACDAANNVYITGFTYSTNGIATSGAHQEIFGGDEDGFLAKFDSAGAIQWGTYYGGIYGDIAGGIACDAMSNVYITGETFSPNNIATPGSYMDSLPAGEVDLFISQFNDSGALLWATYYGCGTSLYGYEIIAIDDIGNIYMASSTLCEDNIATPGSYQTINLGETNPPLTEYNAFLIKFDTGNTGVKIIHPEIQSATLFPNPNDGNFIVSGTLENSNDLQIEVENISGQIVYSKAITIINGTFNETVHLPIMPPGEYLLIINAGNESKTIKFTINKH